jgi:hypothetical protein
MADATFSTRPNLRLRTSVYLEAQSQAGNYSVFRVQLYLVETAQQSSYSAIAGDNSWSMSVNGTGYGGNFTYDARPSGLQSWLLLNTTYTIGHDSAGNLGAIGYAASASSVTLGGSNTPIEYAYAGRIAKPPGVPPLYSATATNSSGAIQMNFAAPADNGGAGISEYILQWAWDAGFTSNLAQMSTGNGGQIVSGLEVGRRYYFRVLARNGIGDSGWSGTVSAIAPGQPGQPTGVAATPSTSVTGRVAITWVQPAVTGEGGIVGYNIFRDGVQIATTTGTGGTYTDSGLTPFTTYTYAVAARNNFSTTVGGTGAWSAAAGVVAQGPPTAPRTLTGTADQLVPGKIDLSWVAPVSTGNGGITGYRIRFSTEAVALTTSGTGTSASVTGLNPGQVYTFKVHALNALATAEGTESVASNTYTVQALGEPPAPTGLTVVASSAIAGRLTLSWNAPAGGVSGYNVFSRNTTTNVDTLIATIKSHTFVVDGLTPGVPVTYVIRARNSYTDTLNDGYPGTWGGPATAPVTATPVSDTSQAVTTGTTNVTDSTNETFNGTFTVNAVTPTTIRYAKVAANVASAAVSAGTVGNNTNAVFNGTYTVSTPTPTTLTYAKAAANIPSATVSGGALTNSTNASFNGLKTITAINVAARTISYVRNGVAVASVTVPINTAPGASGSISNTTNAVYNTTTDAVITGATPTTIQYSKNNVNLAESNAAGTVTDTTNRDFYNGTHIITGVPTYNTFTFTTAGPDQSAVVPIPAVAETAHRAISPSQLEIKYRSGWAG